MIVVALAGLLGQPAAADRLERTISVGGLNRSYIAHFPDNLSAQASWPVVFAFHPALANGAGMERMTGLHEEPRARDYIVVYPDGYRRAWNAGYCCGAPYQRGVDDVGFVSAILADLATMAPVRPRIYITGFSNGAMLVYRLVCDRSDMIAAAAPYGAVLDLGRTRCNASTAVPILHIHGLDDPRAPFAGGASGRETVGVHPPVEQVVDQWSAHNGCSRVEGTNALPGASCEAHEGCSTGAEVILCAVPGLGHNWPGGNSRGARLMNLGPTRPDVDASAAILEFFDRHR
jgi:polyhydroxybutyrate depolymerase